MGHIYIPKEIIERIKASQPSNEVTLLVEKFDPNRDESRKPKNENPKTDKQSDTKGRIINKTYGSARHISDEEWEKIKQNASRSGDSKKYKEILLNQSKKRALIKKYGISQTSPTTKAKKLRRKVKRRVIEIKYKNTDSRRYKAERPLYDNRNKDNYDFAGEYEARNVEFGHGKKKDWKGVKASGLNADIRRGFQRQKTDPNSFDRQAMK